MAYMYILPEMLVRVRLQESCGVHVYIASDVGNVCVCRSSVVYMYILPQIYCRQNFQCVTIGNIYFFQLYKITFDIYDLLCNISRFVFN